MRPRGKDWVLATAVWGLAAAASGGGRCGVRTAAAETGPSRQEIDLEVKEELTGAQKKVAALFTASKVTFDKQKIVIEYNFESKDDQLTTDWLPAINARNQRIRWAQGIEGTPTSVEHGIIVGDQGEWFVDALFAPDVEVELDVLGMSPYKAGNIIGPVFYNDKKKRALGANEGSQVVCLANRKHARPPIPKAEKVMAAATRHRIGYAFNGKSFEARHNGRKMADTSSAPKMLDGFDAPGRVGLIWTGSIQYFIFKVTIKGTLDPEWLKSKVGADVAVEATTPGPGGGDTGTGEKDKSRKAKNKAKTKAKKAKDTPGSDP